MPFHIPMNARVIYVTLSWGCFRKLRIKPILAPYIIPYVLYRWNIGRESRPQQHIVMLLQESYPPPVQCEVISTTIETCMSVNKWDDDEPSGFRPVALKFPLIFTKCVCSFAVLPLHTITIQKNGRRFWTNPSVIAFQRDDVLENKCMLKKVVNSYIKVWKITTCSTTLFIMFSYLRVIISNNIKRNLYLAFCKNTVKNAYYP